MKSEGRADTKHNDPIDEDTEEKLNDLMALLQKVMEEKDRTSENYKKLLLDLACLVPGYENSWHKLVQWCMMYIIMKYHARRGREGMDELKKCSFAKTYDAKNNSYQYVKVVGEASKNNRDTDQDLSKEGVIPFTIYKNGKILLDFSMKSR